MCSSTAGKAFLAVFVRKFDAQSQYYASNGKWVHRKTKHTIFLIPQMVTSEHVAQVIPFLPTGPISEENLDRFQSLDVSVPREAGAPILKKLGRFQREADRHFRKHADKLNRMYDVLANENPNEGRILNVEEIAKMILPLKDPSEITKPLLWSIHRVLERSNMFKVKYRRHQYFVVPRNELVGFSRVIAWLREYQESVVGQVMELHGHDSNRISASNPIASFAQKAQRLVKESRESRAVISPSNIGPSARSAKAEGQHGRSAGLAIFSQDEKIIIDFLVAWAFQVNRNSTLLSICPLILRAVGVFENTDLDEAAGFLLLQQIGILSPWENRTRWSTDFCFPGDGRDITLDNAQEQALRSAADFEATDDSMVHLRKTWDSDVFCIDDANAREIDDGISLEEIPGSPSMYWIHVHVANPSAFMTPNHPMARFAAQLNTSIYLPEQKCAMLPYNISQKYFSLAKNRPVITFSAKISVDGDVLDIDVSHGYIRRVHFITPESLQEALGDASDYQQPRARICVGGDPLAEPELEPEPKLESDRTLTDSHKATLQVLSRISSAWRAKCLNPDVGRTLSLKESLKVSVDIHPGGPLRDPTVTLHVSPHTKNFVPGTRSPSEQVVSSFMIMGGIIGATWCKQRNIPIPYKGSIPNPEPDLDLQNSIQEYMDHSLAEDGQYSVLARNHMFKTRGQVVTSLQPLYHADLGIEVYAKLTSPLRRFPDLMAHWQIEAAIRGDALPFPHPEALKAVTLMIQREGEVSRATRESTWHWVAQCLFRAFYFGEAQLPETFSVFIMQTGHVQGTKDWIGVMDFCNSTCLLLETEASSRMGGIHLGDTWEAKISSIDCFKRQVYVTPVMLRERGYTPWLTKTQ